MPYRRKQITYTIEQNNCYLCTSHKPNKKGYPNTETKRKNNKRGEHQNLVRFLYEERYGKLPKHIVMRHKCDNKLCINLEHIETGSAKDNMNDFMIRGNPKLGSQKTNAKLNEEQVKDILKSKEGPRKLGRIYNVAHTTIIRIKQNKKWKHIL